MAPPEHLTPELFRRACGQFATGIAVLTTCDLDRQPQGMTINSFTSLSLDPPLVMAAIARTSNLLSIFENASHYAINVLADDQQELSDRFARRMPHRFDGLDEGLQWTRGNDGVPLLAGALATLECRIAQIVNAGDHRVFIGQVESAIIGEGGEKPLLYFRGRYAGIE